MTFILKKTGVIIVVYCAVLLCFVGGKKKNHITVLALERHQNKPKTNR